MINKKDVKDMYFLSPMQEGMLFHYLLDKESPAYFEQTSYRTNGELDYRLFERSFNRLIDRYDVLRTIFIYEKLQRPVQVVLKRRETSVHYEDISYLKGDELERAIKEFKIKDRKRGFDLEKDILIRLAILKLADNKYEIVWSFHHILMDGWCISILVKDMLLIYYSLLKGENIKLPPAAPYMHYIKWLGKQDQEAGIKYWKSYLEDYENQAVIPRGAVGKPEKYEHKIYRFALYREFGKEFIRISNENKVTMSTIIQALWGILLQKYNNTDDVVFGAIVSGRPANLADVETMIGLFINAIPLRVKSEHGETFVGLVKKIQVQMIQARSYEYLPLAEIQSQSPLKQELISNLFIFENYPVAKEIKNTLGDNLSFFSVESVETFEQTNYDLTITALFLEELIINLSYNAGVYDDSVIKRIENHLERISEQITCGEIPLEEIEIISPAEKNQIIFEFNRTEEEYPNKKTIHQLFEEHVEKSPDSIALIGADTLDCPIGPVSLSYRQLNVQSNWLAEMLIEKGVLPDTIVGIMMERSEGMIIGIMGILKSGAAYLPIDPGFPQERIDYMLKDSSAPIILTDYKKEIIVNCELMNLHSRSLAQAAINYSISIKYHSSYLAYVIYTSGSTGQPKGVLIKHRSVINFIKGITDIIPFTANDRILSLTTISFDIFGLETLVPLASGSMVVMGGRDEQLDIEATSLVINRECVSIFQVTPSRLQMMISLQEEAVKLKALKFLLVGGEAFPGPLLEKIRAIAPGKIFNMYGPTETTIWSSVKEVGGGGSESLSIGKPIANTTIYIFNGSFHLTPIGLPGELYIGGDGLARGYLNRTELTAEKFVMIRLDKSNRAESSERVYKTGDLACWLPDGNIEFLGRIDHQVKIRGFRIELGEIESKLNKHINIKEAVVLVQEGDKGDKYLCAYFVPTGKYEMQEILEYLAKELPDYMIPSYFVPLEKIPLTPNGKIDRKALPKPMVKVGGGYTAPRNEIEKKLVTVWAEILSRNPLHASQLRTSIGLDDNFFHLGGHSLKATVLASRVHKELNVVLPLAEIFKTPTIRGLSKYIKGTVEDVYESITPAEERDYFELSFAQKRMYILQQIDLNNTAYNMPQIVPLVEDADISRLEQSFRKLIERHDSLRTSFHMIGEQPVQRIHEHVEFKIEYKNSSTDFSTAYTDELEDRLHHSSFMNTLSDFVRPFDLSKAPLLLVGLLRLGSKQHLLLVDMHHIISDGISHQVLREDFMALYTGRELPPLRLQYKDFAQWQNSQGEVERIHQQMEYWLKEFEGEIPVLEIPTDYPRPISQSFEGDSVEFEISVAETRALNAVALQDESTLFMVLATVFNILLSFLSSQEDIIIGTTVAGRKHADLEKIIGIFVNTLVLRNFPIGDRTFKEFLVDIKERTMGAFENQEYPFEMLVDKLSVKRDMGRNPLFDVMFVLQNMDNNTVSRGAGEKDSFETDTSIQQGFPREFENIVRTSQFDLTLTAQEINGRLFLFFQYCTKLFKKETIERFIAYFKRIVSCAVKSPDIRLREIDVKSEAEKQQILYEFNDTSSEYPKDKTIHRLFEEVALKAPDHIALVGAGPCACPVHVSLSYRQLNEQSDRLAGLLIKKGALADTIVGIMMERSVEMIIGLVGILKSGGAYLPIDPEYPQQRIDYIMKDSGAKLLAVENDQEGEKLSVRRWEGEKVLLKEIYESSKNSSYPLTFLPSYPLCPRNLAYVIYTSGTTGKPKGVLVEHKNVVRLMINDKFQFNFGSRDVWTMFHSYNFDFSVWEIYGALLYGGKLIIVPKMVARDPGEFLGILRREQVTILNQTPSAFYNLIEEELKSDREDLNIRYVIFGGEALKPVKLRKWKEKYPGTKLINMFGITETTVHVTYKDISDNEIDLNISNIGSPIPTTTTYVMDRYLNLPPLGVAGELCVGGEGVARGYLNRPELTAEKFKHDLGDNRDNQVEKNKSKLINKSFAGVQGGLFQNPPLVYRSGDLARLLPNGEIEYLGRIDHQVQLKGFRIELGEIENNLLRFKGITEAVVITRENDDSGYQYLCAYIVPEGDIDITLLRESLTRTLPEYMIPQYFVLLEKIPLTVNGKVDRSKLLEPGLNIASWEEYMTPADKTQEKLVEIWRQVLRLERIGIKDNYFNLGGDSIKAIALVNAINSEFQSKLKIVDLYMNQTIEGLSLKLIEEGIQQGEENEFAGLLPELEEFKSRVMKIVDDPGNIEDIFPMSDIEKGMVYHYIKDAMTAVYHDQPVYQMVYSDFDIERMRQAFGLMMEKHPILRTAYILDEFAHIVYKRVPMDIPYYDISGKDKASQEAFVALCMEESRNRPFDVQVPPLWRMSIFNTGMNDRFVFLWEFHHVIIDGWSNSSLLTELNNTYMELKQNPRYIPQELRCGYKDYILQQIAEKRNPGLLDYWKHELSDYKRLTFPMPMELNRGKSREETVIKRIIMDKGIGQRKKLDDIAIKYNTTVKHLCFAAYAMMLSMLSYENDIVLGLVTNNRPLSEDGNRLIGCFLNTFPVRINIPGRGKWSEFIHAVDAKLLEVKKYDRLSLPEIALIIGEQTTLENPIIDTLFSLIDFYMYQQLQFEEAEGAGGIAGTGQNNDKSVLLNVESYEKTNFPFEMTVNTSMGGFLVWINYFCSLLDEECARRLFGYFERVLDEFINNPEGELDRSAIMSPLETHEILYTFNSTEADYPWNKMIQQLFEEQTERMPDRIAVLGRGQTNTNTDDNMSITYRLLNERSDRLTGMLIEKGVLVDNIVAIMMERSIEMIIGIFGILKSGGAYLPIDPEYPQERIDYMLKDSGASILLADYRKEIILNCQFLIINCKLLMSAPQAPFRHSSFIIHHSSHLAYIIYTSGTTGRPKGSLIEHRNVVRLLFNDKFQFNFSDIDVWTLFHSFCFDFSVWEMYGALLYGGKLVIVPKMVTRDTFEFLALLKKEAVTVLNQTPLAFYNLINEESNSPKSGEKLFIKYVIFGGEALNPSKLKDWREKYPQVQLINMFGITETTVHVTYKEINREDMELNISNIGKPIPTLKTYILNNCLKPVPKGVTGEICVGGDGVARGYLNRVELTGGKFIENPYRSEDRLYRSGDMGRFLENGDMEYLGRIDHQVKIRGFRIELGEIENQLRNYKLIKEAVVIDRSSVTSGLYLCAYIVPRVQLASNGGDFNIHMLREFLSHQLPDYMIPSYFVKLEQIPINANGKIDRKALPDPEGSEGISLRDDGGYIPPSSDVEKKLVEIWEKVLGRKKIGINENFFMIGGDSIKSIQIMARMSNAGYKLEMKDLFQFPVISELVPYVKKLERIPDQTVITGKIPLTPIQQMFFQHSHFSPHHFNQAVMFYSKIGLDKEIIKKVFTKIQEHHDALRMTYKINPETGQAVQTNHGLDYPLSIDEYDLKNNESSFSELNRKVNELQASIDLEKGPLMKLGLFHLDDGDRLLIVIHHLVIDGVSWRILFEDIETLYGQYMGANKPELLKKTDSFKFWSEKLSAYANHKTFLKEKIYWQKLESVETPSLPKGFEADNDFIKDTAIVSFTLGEEETERLLTKVNEAFRTEINDLLLTSLGLGIKKTFGQERLLIALEGHGREEILQGVDINRTVGWFTSVYPVVLDVSYAGDLGRQIKEIKEILRRIPNKGIGYGVLKYLTEETNKKDIKFKLKPQICFNYLGQFDEEVKQVLSFEIARESTGNSQSPNNSREYLLDVSGITANGRLSITVAYNKRHFKPDTIGALTSNFELELKRLIAFCSSKQNREFTPSDFTYKGLSIENIDLLVKLYPDLEDLYTLTPMQDGMLYHALADDSSYSYFEQISYRLQGKLDIAYIEKSLNELFKRHDILRTAFVYKDIERPVQLVLKERVIDFHYEDLSKLAGREERENFIEEFKKRDKDRSFDLSQEALMRVSILQIEESEYEFSWSFHHIVMDGWCIGILNTEFFEIYNGYLENRPCRLPEVKPYRTYIKWLEKHDKEESLRYWKNYLDSYEEQTGVPKTIILEKEENRYRYRNETVLVELDKERTVGLNKLASGNHVTLNVVTQTLWGVLLGKYNSKEDVVFGAVVSGRPFELEGVESMVGLFINTIPVRINCEGRMKFHTLLQKVQQEALAGEPYHYQPLAEIQSGTVLKQNLLDHLFIFENYPIGEQIEGSELPGREQNESDKKSLQLSNVEVFEQTNYDFNVILGGADRLQVTFQYNGNVYDEDFVNRIAKHFCLVLEQVIADQGVEVRELTFLSEEEKDRILFEFNNTDAVYPKDKTIQQLFEEQSELSPDHIALIGSSVSTVETFRKTSLKIIEPPLQITYHQLNEQSNQLAGLLIEKGVLADNIVAIMIERSIEMIVGILGILKSGGAYLPIDPDYPQERINYMLKDSAAKLLVTAIDKEGAKLSVRRWEGEKVSLEKISKSPKSSSYPLPFIPTYLLNPSNLAYIIYTSGSTGKPKGVMVEHRSVVNLICSQDKYFKINSSDRIMQFSSICFDASVEQIFIAFSSGAVLVLIDKNTLLDAEKFAQFVSRHLISHIHAVPSFLSNMHLENRSQVKRVIAGGDICPVSLAEKWHARCNFYNEYGPTETTVTSIEMLIKNTNDFKNRLPIGKPIGNTTVYLLDQWMKPVPLGVIGNLYIGGTGVARGYLDRPELTAERFIKYRSPGSYRTYIIYKTGDLARWLLGGNIEFLGRIDYQVKIRGFRIELGEIETKLNKNVNIKEAAVLSQEGENGDKYLCAYFVPAAKYEVQKMKEYLSKELPDYMIPTYFVPIEKIPLTANGKIDRKALPNPEVRASESYTAPRNKIEKRLIELWAEILGRDELHTSQLKTSIGVNDNFFQLGGHSLKATLMVSKIHKELNVRLPLAEIFERSTIRELAGYLSGKVGEKYESILPVEKREYYELSSAQKRLYFLQQLEPNIVAYNIPVIIPLTEDVHVRKLEDVFRELIKRHDSLRTSFHIVNDASVQIIHNEVVFDIEQLTKIETFFRPFDLSRAPLLRVGIKDEESKRQILIVDIHHIITDGTSHGVLKRDFMSLYKGEKLNPLRIQYKDFAGWQNSNREREELKRQELYWLKEFAGEKPVLNIPTDYPRPIVQSYEGNSVGFEVSAEDTRFLNALALKEGATLFMVLAEVLNILLAKLSGQEDIVIGVPVAGRRHADLEKIIGMFVNTLVLRNFPCGEKSFHEFLKELKERTLEAFENQEYQFEDLVEKTVTNRDMSRNPLFDVLLTVQNINKFPEEGYDTGTIETEAIDTLLPTSERYAKSDRVAKFDLEITAMEVGQELKMVCGYCTKLFKKETIERFIIYFKKIVTTAAQGATIKLKDIEIISEEEKKQIINDFNNTRADYPDNKTIHQLFEEQVQIAPDRIAVIGSTVEVLRAMSLQITYHQLNERSGRLAGLLIEKGIRMDSIVGLMMGRSVEMIIGIIGILKSGAAYLPIDPEYPQERIEYILEDSNVKILLGMEEYREKIAVNCQLLIVNCKLNSAAQAPLHHSSFIIHHSTQLAYVIYTSGSTGKPKGVMINHRAVINFLKGIATITPFTAKDRILSLTTISFDIFGCETLVPLTSGSLVVMGCREPQLNIEAAGIILKRECISIFQVTPSRLQMIISLPGEAVKLKILKFLLVGGEAFPESLLEKVRPIVSGKIFNMYGPTETTIYSCVKEVGGRGVEALNIGKPIANTIIYILSSSYHLAPIGVPGELCIGGDGLARGYLNRSELTTEKFILIRSGCSNRLESSNRIYKTGDLARWLSDGNIEFLGRLDHQVKIRGFRIELGEIESRFQEIKHIKQACVIDRQRKSGERYLCAYFVAEQTIDPGSIRNTLGKCLPDYMIPLQLIQIEKIPLTPNGKANKQALQTITSDSGAVISRDFIAPKSNTEKIIARIWEDILELDKIGLTDNFFEIGGTSMDIISVTNRLKEALNRDIPMVHIFQYPNIGALAEYYDREESENGFVGDNRLEAITRGKQDRMRRLQKKRGENK